MTREQSIEGMPCRAAPGERTHNEDGGAHEMGGMKGHGYWYANEVISTDVTLSLRYPIPPDQRCLRPKGNTRVWRMPEDYVDCVATRLLQAYPALRR